ncbi:hypothetical protein ACERJO_20280 [Halalkalibacter sp. AB-rgal2]|uniref:hypothetical protein n=1 Tax=Halalkalibacter sp. AB-rgal2 TaxID=3242695 RepID=UPI00359EB16B
MELGKESDSGKGFLSETVVTSLIHGELRNQKEVNEYNDLKLLCGHRLPSLSSVGDNDWDIVYGPYGINHLDFSFYSLD